MHIRRSRRCAQSSKSGLHALSVCSVVLTNSAGSAVRTVSGVCSACTLGGFGSPHTISGVCGAHTFSGVVGVCTVSGAGSADTVGGVSSLHKVHQSSHDQFHMQSAHKSVGKVEDTELVATTVCAQQLGRQRRHSRWFHRCAPPTTKILSKA